MKLREPEVHAQRLNDALFDSTGALSTVAHDIRQVALAMCTLGLSSGEDLYRMSEEISVHARAAANAHSEYVGRQAEGTLYSLISSNNRGSEK